MRTLKRLLSLRGRVAVITGGSGHLAQAVGEAVAELGAAVVIVDLNQGACAKRAATLSKRTGTPCLPVAIDLSKEDSASRIVSQTLSRFGRLDILVNNAAFTGASSLRGYAVPFQDQTRQAWEAAIQVNLTAAFQLVQTAQKALTESGHGTIINIGSIYGVVGPDLRLYSGTRMGNPAAYAASKGALINLTRYLSTVMAPHVRVNSISPGGIERGQPASFKKRYVAKTPLGRMANEEDFKGVVAFLASDASEYVTGQNIMVDGGFTAW